MRKVLEEVYDEMVRQEELWGVQNHPDFSSVVYDSSASYSSDPEVLPRFVADYYGVPTQDVAKNACEDAFTNGNGSWAHIFIEEVAESVAASCEGESALRAELVQVAAVTTSWIRSIDRRRAGTGDIDV